MQINDLKEFNCLMRYGQKEGINHEYWTDGNDVENTGVWTHAHDNSEVTFFGRRIGCSCLLDNPESVEPVHVPCPNGGDAFRLSIGGEKQERGNYCDKDSSNTYLFICENII